MKVVPKESKWEVRWREMVAFHKAKKHCLVSHRENPALFNWLTNQRRHLARGVLWKAREERLDALDPMWSRPVDQRFAVNCGKVAAHLRRGKPETLEKELQAWLAVQRRAHKAGKLKKEWIAAFESLPVPHEVMSARWEAGFERLSKFHKRHGHCRVLRCDDLQLYYWINKQREAYRAAKSGKHSTRVITAERISRLDGLGFIWEVEQRVHYLTSKGERKWQGHLKSFLSHRKRHGHDNIRGTSLHNQRLKSWVSTQRMAFKRRRLFPERLKILRAVHFPFESPVVQMKGATNTKPPSPRGKKAVSKRTV